MGESSTSNRSSLNKTKQMKPKLNELLTCNVASLEIEYTLVSL